MKSIGTAIKNLRLSKNITQKELSKAIEVSREMVTLIESDDRNATLENLKKICYFFGIKLWEFIKEIED
jgi:transcriptional regulator with XRE-family HTH domain